MKSKRQNKLLELIAQSPVETQEELQALLIENGFAVTQATISRDIRELGLIKTATPDGGYRYMANQANTHRAVSEKFARIFAEAAHSVDCAGNLVVIKAYAGMGSAIGVAIDSMNMDGVVGTLAGDDTLLIIVRSEERASELRSLLAELIKAG